jgi:hypothetical protein
MKITIYKSKTNPDLGFSIQEVKGEISLWVDEYEGGEAYQDDWTYDDEQPEFKTAQEAYDYIVENNGEVELIDTY